MAQGFELKNNSERTNYYNETSSDPRECVWRVRVRHARSALTVVAVAVAAGYDLLVVGNINTAGSRETRSAEHAPARCGGQHEPCATYDFIIAA